VARITRKELKSDKFALEVEHTVNFFEDHRQEIVRYGGIALVAVVLIIGYIIYSGHQHAQREEALARLKATRAAYAELQKVAKESWADAGVVADLRSLIAQDFRLSQDQVQPRLS